MALLAQKVDQKVFTMGYFVNPRRYIPELSFGTDIVKIDGK
jgi:hypothetical protein